MDEKNQKDVYKRQRPFLSPKKLLGLPHVFPDRNAKRAALLASPAGDAIAAGMLQNGIVLAHGFGNEMCIRDSTLCEHVLSGKIACSAACRADRRHIPINRVQKSPIPPTILL